MLIATEIVTDNRHSHRYRYSDIHAIGNTPNRSKTEQREIEEIFNIYYQYRGSHPTGRSADTRPQVPEHR
jgi:hypothetical protein